MPVKFCTNRPFGFGVISTLFLIKNNWSTDAAALAELGEYGSHTGSDLNKILFCSQKHEFIFKTLVYNKEIRVLRA